MSLEPSKQGKNRPKPPFYGPDGRYRPPVEDGELPLHLPDHIELDRLAREEQLHIDDAYRRADAERRRADRLAAKLRELGIDPDDV